MESRLALAGGLAAGVLTGIVVMVALVALAPGLPGATSTDPPAAPTPPPSTTPAQTAPASAAPSPTDAGPIIAAFRIGESAPPLVVPRVGGGTIDLAALAGRPVWVNFMGTYCPECIDEFPRMNGFAVRYEEHGLAVVAVDVREEEPVVAEFAESLNATFPIGLDPDGSAAEAWGAVALPIHFWVDAEGIIRDGAIGGIGPDVMARGVGRILPGVEVTP